MARRPAAKSGRHLIPALDSRHRIACLALCRALLRLAPQISLPDDLASGWGPGKNPIAIHIQRAFRRNVADTSPRIVYPALSAGYRMLSVLQDAAASPSSQHHASIVAFLQSRLAERQRSLANRPPPPPPSYNPKSDVPHPDTLPLLLKVSPPPSPSNPDPTPVYTTPHRPRPQSELGGTGRRKIPRLDLASDIPFLRFTKPQPALLSRVLRQKSEKRTGRMQALTAMQAEDIPEAQLEDEWESQMAHLMIAEKRVKRDNRSSGDTIHKGWQDEHDVGVGNRRDERSHAYTLERHGVRALADLLTRERVKEVAIADAMRQLIIQEKVLAAQEEAQRHAERRAKWEAKMLELHGEGWRELFPNLEESAPEEPPVQQRKRARRRSN
ncbi:hypothetical protein F5Y07DRAFT_71189 [Xylaria sp. FL0933]|nr:hypothetical protein F5Y07DRAFT_71189 [Xylaria sp. FL0933]